MRLFAAAFIALLATNVLRAEEMPIFDAHLHYSHDAWEMLPVDKVIEILREAGVKRALVSSSGDAGQQRLYKAAPQVIIPELRPYRRRGETGSWMRDESVIPYLEDNLKKHLYVGIGEFHLYGADADLAVPRRMVALAKQYDIFLHAHSDAEAIERLFKQWPQARILWAHSGFDRPDKVREMLRKYPGLWCDLAYRTDHASNGKVDPDWREAFLEFPDRFLVGSDTFTPERWFYVPEHAKWSRGWLADLPKNVAERIAWKNGETVFGALLARRQQ
jgi:Amidohydrolase